MEKVMSDYQILHNPRCSKSRETLAILESKGISPEIILYLEDAPTVEQITSLLKKLGATARDIMRTGEEAYKELKLADAATTERQLIDAMAAHPRLIERPIVIKGDKAIIGRPPERVLELIG
jgi:arsenate reductase (glutaredoxin)